MQESKESLFLSLSSNSNSEPKSNSLSEPLETSNREQISDSPSESLENINSTSTLSDSPLGLVESDQITSESIS